MRRIKAHSIEWDVDIYDDEDEFDDEPLPGSAIVDFPDEATDEDIDNELADRLSDLYGFCVFSLGWEDVN